ncbi:MAG: hypothetical protein ABIA93_04305 [Candidatus Woesearchaeota archaeon]
MSSTKLLKIAKRIAIEEKPAFDVLMDFEKTKEMHSKTRLNFTIDKALAAKFRRYCRANGYSMSAKIEDAMKTMTGRKNLK